MIIRGSLGSARQSCLTGFEKMTAPLQRLSPDERFVSKSAQAFSQSTINLCDRGALRIIFGC